VFVLALVGYLLALGLVIGLGAMATTVNPRRRAAAAERFAAAAGVRLTPELAADLTRRLLRRDRFDLAGRVLGALAIFVFGGVLGLAGIFFGLLAGLGGARGLAQLTEVRRAAARGARVTHLVTPRLTDYVRPVAVLCVRAVALAPAVLAVLWFGGGTRAAEPDTGAVLSGNDRTVLATAGVAAASLLIAEIGARLVLRLRRVAGSPAELALDDALRVSALRDLAVLPLVLGVFGSFLIGASLPADISSRLSWLGSLAPGVVVTVLAAVALGVETARARAWRRRLHPETTVPR
jgi:hypothetical protein